MFSHVSVHPSFCPQGVYPTWPGGRVPWPGPGGGISQPGPPRGVPPARGGGTLPGWGGTPPQVPPHQTWSVGTLTRGVPCLRYPPSDLAGGYPCQGGTPPRVTDGVLDTPRSVCLLHSRRRTFLFNSFSMAQPEAGTGTLVLRRVCEISLTGKFSQD